MSLIVTTHIPTGIIMGADSRLTRITTNPITGIPNKELVDDLNQKIFNIQNKFGISTHGNATINDQLLQFHLMHFVDQSVNCDTEIDDLPELLLRYFSNSRSSTNLFFHLAGYKLVNGIATQYVYRFEIHDHNYVRINSNNNTDIFYNATCGGETEVLVTLRDARVVNFSTYSQQQAIEFTEWVISTATTRLNSTGYSSVGGPIDILVISPNGAQWQRMKPSNINVL